VATRKNILKVDPFEDLRVFGIATTKRDYVLAWHMNEKLGLDLKRLDNLRQEEGEDTSGFSFYFYDEGENQNTFNLLSNNGDGQILLKMPARIDFFLIIRNPVSETRIATIINTIRNISGVFLAFELELAKHKQLDTILEELEFHEMSIQKKQQRKHHRN
jgi:hypothetical protein